MTAEIADKAEMFPEARIPQHRPCIAANRKAPACFKAMMPVKDKYIRMIGDRPLIDHRLAIILAGTF